MRDDQSLEDLIEHFLRRILFLATGDTKNNVISLEPGTISFLSPIKGDVMRLSLVLGTLSLRSSGTVLYQKKDASKESISILAKDLQLRMQKLKL